MLNIFLPKWNVICVRNRGYISSVVVHWLEEGLISAVISCISLIKVVFPDAPKSDHLENSRTRVRLPEWVLVSGRPHISVNSAQLSFSGVTLSSLFFSKENQLDSRCISTSSRYLYPTTLHKSALQKWVLIMEFSGLSLSLLLRRGGRGGGGRVKLFWPRAKLP